MTDLDSLLARLEKRAKIRRQISTRKSIQEGKPDRIADDLDAAAAAIRALRADLVDAVESLKTVRMIEDRDECSSRCGAVARAYWTKWRQYE